MLVFRQLTNFDRVSERNLDAKSVTYYFLPREHAICRWDRRNVGNFAGSMGLLEPNSANHPKQSLPLCLSVCSLRATEFRV